MRSNWFEKTNSSLQTVIFIALISRIFVWIISYATHQAISDYDTSSELLFTHYSGIDKTIWNMYGQFVKWDAIYFMGIAENDYKCEQFFAFLPGFPSFIKLWAYALEFATIGYLNLRTCFLLSGFFISNLAFVLSAVALFWTTNLITNVKESLLVVAIYCLSPANVFLASIYTESLFCLFSFLGFYFYISGSTWKACGMFLLCSCIRSNALLYVGFIAWVGAVQLLQCKSISTKRGAIILRVAIQSLLVVLPYVAFQYYGYQVHCTNGLQSPWCSNNIPHMYSYVQSHYWNQGFLKYWTLKQLPNFLIAAPTVIITTTGALSYFNRVMVQAQSNPRFMTEWLTKRPTTSGFYQQNPTMFVLTSYWLCFMIFCLLNFHVQTITRFFSSIPTLYWYTATFFFERNAIKGKLLLFFFLMYNIIGITLFSNFYPWT